MKAKMVPIVVYRIKIIQPCDIECFDIIFQQAAAHFRFYDQHTPAFYMFIIAINNVNNSLFQRLSIFFLIKQKFVV